MPFRLAERLAETSVDRALEGPLPETIARSIVEHRVLQRFTSELLADVEVDAAITSVLEQERTEHLARKLTDRLVASPEFHRVLKTVLSSPEVRAVLTQQTTTFGTEVTNALRRRMIRLDSAASRSVGPVPYAGIATRGVAFTIDALFVHLIFLLGAALVGLVSAIFGRLRPEWLVGTLAGCAWLLVVSSYFATFWSTTGQTPGMRVLGLRLRTSTSGMPGVGRALLRLVFLALAIVPLFAGILPILVDRRRRGLHDLVAGTLVVYDEATPIIPNG